MKRTRDKMLRIRLTEDEYDLITRKAAEAGMSRTAFILHSAEQHSTEVVGSELLKTYAELNRQGVNLNRIAKFVYGTGSVPEGLPKVIAENHMMLKAVRYVIDAIGRTKN